MGTKPSTIDGQIQFCEGHISPWTTNATAIGTTTTAVTNLQTLTEAARAALSAQTAAQQAAVASTNELKVQLAAMNSATADIIKQIRTKAATAGDGIYTLAEIPAPATPTPVTTLGKPNNFTAELGENGALTIKWKNANPRSASGVVYQVWRRTDPTAPFDYLGGSGGKEYTDNTIPAGSSQITYQIQAVRSTAAGPWAQFNVNFGAGASGAITATVEVTKVTKKAA